MIHGLNFQYILPQEKSHSKSQNAKYFSTKGFVVCSLCRERGHPVWGAAVKHLKMTTYIKVALHISMFSQSSPLLSSHHAPQWVLALFFKGGKRRKHFVIMEGQFAVEGEHKLSVLLQNSLSFLSCETSVIHIWNGNEYVHSWQTDFFWSSVLQKCDPQLSWSNCLTENMRS